MAKNTTFHGSKQARTGSLHGNKLAIIAEDFAWMPSQSNLLLSTKLSKIPSDNVSSFYTNLIIFGDGV